MKRDNLVERKKLSDLFSGLFVICSEQQDTAALFSVHRHVSRFLKPALWLLLPSPPLPTLQFMYAALSVVKVSQGNVVDHSQGVQNVQGSVMEKMLQKKEQKKSTTEQLIILTQKKKT